jgi:hypothetical protein
MSVYGIDKEAVLLHRNTCTVSPCVLQNTTTKDVAMDSAAIRRDKIVEMLLETVRNIRP